jgi:hypothetical protein
VGEKENRPSVKVPTAAVVAGDLALAEEGAEKKASTRRKIIPANASHRLPTAAPLTEYELQREVSPWVAVFCTRK